MRVGLVRSVAQPMSPGYRLRHVGSGVDTEVFVATVIFFSHIDDGVSELVSIGM